MNENVGRDRTKTVRIVLIVCAIWFGYATFASLMNLISILVANPRNLSGYHNISPFLRMGMVVLNAFALMGSLAIFNKKGSFRNVLVVAIVSLAATSTLETIAWNGYLENEKQTVRREWYAATLPEVKEELLMKDYFLRSSKEGKCTRPQVI